MQVLNVNIKKRQLSQLPILTPRLTPASRNQTRNDDAPAKFPLFPDIITMRF